MLYICVAYCKRFCLDFNVKKSKVMIIQNRPIDYSDFCPLKLSDSELDFVSEYKYLGIIVSSDRGIHFPASNAIRSFYRAMNSLLYGRVKPDHHVLMRLLYSNCVPILTYACAVREYSTADIPRCHVAVNNAIRKIFSFAIWQSIRHVRISYGYRSIYELFETAKRKFINSASKSSNIIIQLLSTLPMS